MEKEEKDKDRERERNILSIYLLIAEKQNKTKIHKLPQTVLGKTEARNYESPTRKAGSQKLGYLPLPSKAESWIRKGVAKIRTELAYGMHAL